jgi:hypothetical protein
MAFLLCAFLARPFRAIRRRGKAVRFISIYPIIMPYPEDGNFFVKGRAFAVEVASRAKRGAAAAVEKRLSGCRAP